jgi:hypothetical protein
LRIGAGKYLSAVVSGVSLKPAASKGHMAFWAQLDGQGWRKKEV